MTSLLTGLGGAWWMAKLHREQFLLAEENRELWQREWLRAEETESKWPYTEAIETSGKRFSSTKVLLLVLSGIAFIIGAVVALANGV